MEDGRIVEGQWCCYGYAVTLDGNALVEWVIGGPLLLVDGFLAAVLLRSLLPGRTPLITRIAALYRGEPLPGRVVRYARWVTRLWVVVFAGLASMTAFTLAGVVPPGARLTGLLGHGPVCLGMLLLEYGVRRRHLRDLPHAGLLEFLCFLRQVNYRTLLRS